MDFYKKAGVAGCALALTGLAAVVHILSPADYTPRSNTPVVYRPKTEVLDNRLDLVKEPPVLPFEEAQKEPSIENKPAAVDNNAREPQTKPQRKDNNDLTIDELASRLYELSSEFEGKMRRRKEIIERLSRVGEDGKYMLTSGPEYDALMKEFEELGSEWDLNDASVKYACAASALKDGKAFADLYEVTAKEFPHLTAEITKRIIERTEGSESSHAEMLTRLYDVIPAEDAISKKAVVAALTRTIVERENSYDSAYTWYERLKEREELRKDLPVHATQIIFQKKVEKAEEQKKEYDEMLKACFDDAQRRLRFGGLSNASSSLIKLRTGKVEYEDPQEFIDKFKQYQNLIQQDFDERLRKIYNWED